MRPDVVHAPDDAVTVVALEVRRDEVERDVRRVRPVEEACRKPVVLAEREPVPDGIDGHLSTGRVLTEVPQHVALECPGLSAEPDEARRQVARCRGHTAKGEVGAVAAERLLPRALVELLLELDPARDADLVDHGRLSK